ncbi:MAG: flavin reductase family protein [Planctomycetota bacterium]|jgi:flavin reductase (DIM6/NTAB) family NADH-FMN oxidoreductase RutF
MEIDLNKLEARDAHDLLTSAIIPRPIAWVSSVSAEGDINLAPFSFFSGITWRPPALCFSVVNRSDGSRKDTIRNIEESKDFVVNMVSQEVAWRMVKTAGTFPRGINEADEAEVPLVSSTIVAAPRVKESKVAFECALDQVVTVGQGAHAGNLALGVILLVHIKDELLAAGKIVDPVRFDVVGRLSGTRYCRTGSVFEM